MEELLNKLKTDFEFVTGLRYQGLIKAIGAGFAARLFEFQSKLNFIEKQAFIETADTDYLYAHAGYLVEPLPAAQATGTVIFWGAGATEVAAGIELKDDENSYTLVQNAQIVDTALTATANKLPNNQLQLLGIDTERTINARVTIAGQTRSLLLEWNGISHIASLDSFTVDVPSLINPLSVEVFRSLPTNVVATEVGEASDRDQGAELTSVVTLSLITGVFVDGIGGGKLSEDVDVYRSRVKEYLRQPIAPFNKNSIETLLKSTIPQITRVWIKGGEARVNNVDIYVLGDGDSLATQTVDSALSAVQAIKPAGLPPTNLRVLVTPTKGATITLSRFLPRSTGLESEVRKNLEALFAEDFFERAVESTEVESAIYRAQHGAEKVKSFTLRIDNGAKVGNTLITLSRVQITD